MQNARKHTLHRRVTYLVIDIGAFTTDTAMLTFDTLEGDGDGLSGIEEASTPLGVIDDFDKPVFSELGSTHKIDFKKLIFNERENLKKVLYNGGKQSIVTDKGRVRLGANENDAAILEKHAKNFTGRLLDFVSPLIEKHDTDEILLTGGGSGIGVISKLIKKSFEAYSIKVFNDQEGVDPDEENSVYKWDDSHGLDRVATAIGGSV